MTAATKIFVRMRETEKARIRVTTPGGLDNMFHTYKREFAEKAPDADPIVAWENLVEMVFSEFIAASQMPKFPRSKSQ